MALVWGTKTTGFGQTTAISTINLSTDTTRHQIQVEYIEAATSGIVTPSSGVTITVGYKIPDSTIFVSFSDTIDLSSQVQAKTFNGKFSSIQFTPGTTFDSTCAYRVKYSGWRV